MKISIMQPTYLPWMGYFELMMNSDIFVIFDDVQFSQKSWQSRNRIKTNAGEFYLSVPVLTKGKAFQKINEVEICFSEPWIKKHLKTIELNYKKAKFYDTYIQEFQGIYSIKYNNLLGLNLAIIDFMKKCFSISTPIVFSSSLSVEGGRDEKIIGICNGLKANELYDAAGAESLLDKSLFEKSGIHLIFQNYKHPVYRQLHGDFIPYLSAIDLLFNEGPQSTEIIKSGAA